MARFTYGGQALIEGVLMRGRDAIAVAEMILERMDEHAWDGTSNGRLGMFAMPALPIIAGTTQPATDREQRRRAG